MLHKEFSEHIENVIPTLTYLFNVSNIYRINLIKSQNNIMQLQQKIESFQKI